jgi:hypothetical protein
MACPSQDKDSTSCGRLQETLVRCMDHVTRTRETLQTQSGPSCRILQRILCVACTGPTIKTNTSVLPAAATAAADAQFESMAEWRMAESLIRRAAHRCCASTLRSCSRARSTSSAARASARRSASRRCCARRLPRSAASSSLCAHAYQIRHPASHACGCRAAQRPPPCECVPRAPDEAPPNQACGGSQQPSFAGLSTYPLLIMSIHALQGICIWQPSCKIRRAHLNFCSVPSSAPNMRRLRFFAAGLSSLPASRGRFAMPGASSSASCSAPDMASLSQPQEHDNHAACTQLALQASDRTALP